MQKRGSMLRTLLIVAFLLFAGCSTKVSKPSVLKPDRYYLNALRYTQKGDLAISLENRALLIATYLNPIEKKFQDGEWFFIRVYIDNDFIDEKKAGLFHPGFLLMLHGQKPLQIEPLKAEDELVKKMPFTQKWYRYYLVKFPKSTKKELVLTFSNPQIGQMRLTFPNYDVY